MIWYMVHVLYAAVSIIRPFIKFSRLSILWPLKHIIAPSCTETLGRANLVQCTQYIGRDFSYLHLCIFSKCGILWGNIPSSLNSYPWIIIMEYSGSQLYDDRNLTYSFHNVNTMISAWNREPHLIFSLLQLMSYKFGTSTRAIIKTKEWRSVQKPTDSQTNI